MKNSIAKLWFLSLFDKAGNIDYIYTVMHGVWSKSAGSEHQE